MPDNTPRLSALLTPWQQARARLQQQPDPELLISLSLQLGRSRLSAVNTDSGLLLSCPALPPALWRTELVFSLSYWLNWPLPVVQLLLTASYCCSLSDILPQAQQQPKLQPYPPLLSAKLLQTLAPPALLQLLAACYATERKTAYWRQQPASLLLTLAARLSTPTAELSLSTQLAHRIMHSQCEYELALIRSIMPLLQTAAAPARISADNLCTASAYAQLCLSSNKMLAATLDSSAALREPVLQLASALNRQQQHIKELQLAINLIGREQLDSVLAEAELHGRLTQLHHPQHAMLQQLTNCFAACLQLLAQDQLSLAQSRALACCLCAPLWFDTQGYRYGLLRPNRQALTPLPDFSLYLAAKTGVLLHDLLQHYQLSQWLTPTLNVLAKLQRQPASSDKATVILLIAWYSCQAVFTASAPPLLAKLLALHCAEPATADSTERWLADVAAYANSHCPLLLTL